MVKKSLFGLLGKNLNYSLSPSIFNHYFRKMKIEALYVPLSIPSEFIPELLEKIKQSSFVGLNVTMPYKEKVIPYLDQINEDALKIGAINVIHNLNGKLRGYNTDYTGFIKVLKKHDSLKLESA
ncbi:MAG: shikimate dehydrogenase family protein, partial [Candidatus Aminicenantales bacterium]